MSVASTEVIPGCAASTVKVKSYGSPSPANFCSIHLFSNGHLNFLCFLYLLYLGWKIIGSFSLVEKDTGGRPLKFYEASLFQFINPKAWTVAITVASGFFPTEENFVVGTIFLVITAAVVCFPSICIWAIFGNSLRIFIKNTKFKKITEYILAIMLVLTALVVLLK